MAVNKEFSGILGSIANPRRLGEVTTNGSSIVPCKAKSNTMLVPGDLVKIVEEGTTSKHSAVDKIAANTDCIYGCVVHSAREQVDSLNKDLVSVLISGRIIATVTVNSPKVGEPLSCGTKCCCKITVISKPVIALKQDGSQEIANAYEIEFI